MIEQQSTNAIPVRRSSTRTRRLGPQHLGLPEAHRTTVWTKRKNHSSESPLELVRNDNEGVILELLPIVRFLALRIHSRLPRHVELDDLVSAGFVGLMDAFTKFDPKQKTQFHTYAQFRIRGAILDSLRELDWGPRDLRRKGRAAEEAVRLLTARLGRLPDASEVAGEMGMSLNGYQAVLRDLADLEIGTLHIEHHEGSGEEVLAYIPENREEDPLSCLLHSELKDTLTAAIERLPERECLVMTLRYIEELSMREIGSALSVGESRASQIHTSAVIHLRALLHDPAELARDGDRSQRKTAARVN